MFELISQTHIEFLIIYLSINLLIASIPDVIMKLVYRFTLCISTNSNEILEEYDLIPGNLGRECWYTYPEDMFFLNLV